MKKPALLFSLCFAFTATSFSQYTNKILVKAGENFLSSLSKEIYRYPQFKPGTVVYKDGKMSRADLNYNMLVSEMQFIAPKGDTLSIDNEQTINYILVDKDSFFYDKGYFALVKGNAAVKLAVRERIKVIDKQKIGAYDQPSSTGSIESYNSLQSGNKLYKLDIREDIVLAKETSHFFGDRFNHFIIANKKNSLKMGSNKQSEVEKYFKENNVDFNNTSHMIKLIDFLDDLKRG